MFGLLVVWKDSSIVYWVIIFFICGLGSCGLRALFSRHAVEKMQRRCNVSGGHVYDALSVSDCTVKFGNWRFRNDLIWLGYRLGKVRQTKMLPLKS